MNHSSNRNMPSFEELLEASSPNQRALWLVELDNTPSDLELDLTGLDTGVVESNKDWPKFGTVPHVEGDNSHGGHEEEPGLETDQGLKLGELTQYIHPREPQTHSQAIEERLFRHRIDQGIRTLYHNQFQDPQLAQAQAKNQLHGKFQHRTQSRTGDIRSIELAFDSQELSSAPTYPQPMVNSSMEDSDEWMGHLGDIRPATVLEHHRRLHNLSFVPHQQKRTDDSIWASMNSTAGQQNMQPFGANQIQRFDHRSSNNLVGGSPRLPGQTSVQYYAPPGDAGRAMQGRAIRFGPSSLHGELIQSLNSTSLEIHHPERVTGKPSFNSSENYGNAVAGARTERECAPGKGHAEKNGQEHHKVNAYQLDTDVGEFEPQLQIGELTQPLRQDLPRAHRGVSTQSTSESWTSSYSGGLKQASTDAKLLRHERDSSRNGTEAGKLRNYTQSNFPKYPSNDTPLPDGVSLSEICQRFPNHLEGDVLLRFNSEGWKMQKVWKSCPPDGRRGEEGKNRPWNYLDQRLFRAVKRRGSADDDQTGARMQKRRQQDSDDESNRIPDDPSFESQGSGKRIRTPNVRSRSPQYQELIPGNLFADASTANVGDSRHLMSTGFEEPYNLQSSPFKFLSTNNIYQLKTGGALDTAGAGIISATTRTPGIEDPLGEFLTSGNASFHVQNLQADPPTELREVGRQFHCLQTPHTGSVDGPVVEEYLQPSKENFRGSTEADNLDSLFGEDPVEVHGDSEGAALAATKSNSQPEECSTLPEEHALSSVDTKESEGRQRAGYEITDEEIAAYGLDSHKTETEEVVVGPKESSPPLMTSEKMMSTSALEQLRNTAHRRDWEIKEKICKKSKDYYTHRDLDFFASQYLAVEGHLDDEQKYANALAWFRSGKHELYQESSKARRTRLKREDREKRAAAARQREEDENRLTSTALKARK